MCYHVIWKGDPLAINVLSPQGKSNLISRVFRTRMGSFMPFAAVLSSPHWK